MSVENRKSLSRDSLFQYRALLVDTKQGLYLRRLLDPDEYEQLQHYAESTRKGSNFYSGRRRNSRRGSSASRRRSDQSSSGRSFMSSSTRSTKPYVIHTTPLPPRSSKASSRSSTRKNKWPYLRKGAKRSNQSDTSDTWSSCGSVKVTAFSEWEFQMRILRKLIDQQHQQTFPKEDTFFQEYGLDFH